MVEPRVPDGEAPPGPVVRDRRKIDPMTGQVRSAPSAHAASTWAAAAAESAGSGSAAGTAAPAGPTEHAPTAPAGEPAEVAPAGPSPELLAAQALADERLHDLQRLQAEYMNYRRRVERDRDLAREQAVAAVLESLLPVLDDIDAARLHGDLESGPFAAIADKLESVLNKVGLARYGEPGQPFDPAVHEALVHTQAELAEGTTQTTVVEVLQPGYRSGERVLRAARVSVADPS